MNDGSLVKLDEEGYVDMRSRRWSEDFGGIKNIGVCSYANDLVYNGDALPPADEPAESPQAPQRRDPAPSSCPAA
jgi:hypothetical protein